MIPNLEALSIRGYLRTTCCLAFLLHLPLVQANAADVESCKNAPDGRTLAQAIKEQEITDEKASHLKTGVARSNASFFGWKFIPSDIKIESGPIKITFIFTTFTHVLPETTSPTLAGVRADTTLIIDCLVRTAQGKLWAVVHYREHDKGYLDVENADIFINSR